MFFVCLSSAECVADDGLSLGRRCLITRPLLTYLVAHDSHLNGIARKVQVHQAFLDANRDRTVGGKRRRQIIEFGLVTPDVDVTVQSHRNVVEIVMRLQWCTTSISTCSYGRGRHILFLDVDDCPLLGLFGLTDCVSNRHSADDCENADTQTNFHECPPKIIEAIQLPRIAHPKSSVGVGLLYFACTPLSAVRHADSIRTRGRSEREAHRENPTMIIPVELRHGDLYATANRKMESLRQWKAAQHEARSQENFLLSIQSTARPKSRILFKHGPDLSLDLVVYRGVEDDRPTQEIRASGWKIRTNCALNVPRPDALCSRKSGGQDSVALPVRRGSRRERSTKKESHKIVALAFGCGKRPKLHLPREVSKAIRGLRFMHQIVWRENPHLESS